MGLFSKLFSSKKIPEAKAPASGEEALRQYIEANLPKTYLTSPQYKAEISPDGEGYAVRLTLDMTADGSDYSSFTLEDYLNISELEGGYLLENCLNAPPVPAQFTLNLLFDDRGMALLQEHYRATHS